MNGILTRPDSAGEGEDDEGADREGEEGHRIRSASIQRDPVADGCIWRTWTWSRPYDVRTSRRRTTATQPSDVWIVMVSPMRRASVASRERPVVVVVVVVAFMPTMYLILHISANPTD
jgi:hypothetical protein